ncbi:hypothetical protein [Moritella sp. Urea-trap-13]|uniref:hypothetical protein n=1 Tax=Moritella sp. Urea-trap-13 TaxID=2058327 RepID=UPI000C3394FD|nr:hypothetical protein [Moritella sp. Urea-trap-13]PKH07393.1 hypothetical protein CXF93_07970 [Moritella sp. Urea-trap-13]
MRMKLLTPLLCLGITACSATQPEVIGGDRDAHGCLPAAGYLWCERTQTCERSWELADAAKIEHSEAEVEAYCEIIDSDLIHNEEEW